MKKKIILSLLLLAFGCKVEPVEDTTIMKLWLDGNEINVAEEYEKITTYGEQVEYVDAMSGNTYTKKIFVIHFQKEGDRVELNKEHYAVIFTDWEGAGSDQPIDVGSYVWPSICPVCPRKCGHGAPSKWVRMEIPGDDDVSVSGVAHIEEVISTGTGWTISGDGEGTFYNPYVDANMTGKIEFVDLKIETDSGESPYFDYGGR